MPRGHGRGRKRSETRPEFAGSRGAKRQAGSYFLGADEWSGKERDAGVVAIAGAATVATGEVHQVAGGAGGRRCAKGRNAKSVRQGKGGEIPRCACLRQAGSE